MPSRREFLQTSLAGAAALALAGCAKSAEADPPIEGLQPLRYGPAKSQVVELLLPNEFGPYPVVVIIHGGWWQPGWDRRGVRELARDLVTQGYATWNLEYSLVGEEGGGFPGTFEDVALGIDYLAEKAPDFNLDLSRVVFLGHSAGGTLASWAGSRGTFEAGFVGAAPAVQPTTVISLAGVNDLVLAADQNLGNGAVSALLGGTPQAIPLTYVVASPTLLEPGPARRVLVHALDDDIVPVEQSRVYAEALRAKGASVELIETPTGKHFTVIDPRSAEWVALRDRMDEFLSPPPLGGATSSAPTSASD